MNEAAPSSAPVAVVELTPKEKRAAREAARRAVIQAERERIEAARAATAPADAPTRAAAPTAQLDQPKPRDDDERAADAAIFLRGVLFPLLAVLATVFSGFRLDLEKFTAKQAEDDARAWVPVLRRYRSLDVLVTWVGVPARLVSRVRELAVRKEQTT